MRFISLLRLDVIQRAVGDLLTHDVEQLFPVLGCALMAVSPVTPINVEVI